MTNTIFLQAHNSLNGGCKNHCLESDKPSSFKMKLNNIYNKNQSDNNYSCLSKSLCRG